MSRVRPCGRCPKWASGWCPILGERRVGTAPSCAYGRKLMYNAYMARYMRKAYKSKKEGSEKK